MARPATQLRIVCTPTEDLVELFAREADVLAALAAVRLNLEHAVTRYAAAEGLMAKPRLELLRTRFAPKPEPKS